MKKTLILTLAVLLTLAVMAASAAAQGGSVQYAVGVQIKNLDTTPAQNAVMTYYNQDGSVEATFPIPTIPASGSFTMATLQGVDPGFNGSAVISSENQLGAIANVFGNGTMGASYTAFSGGDDTASLPLILKNHYGFTTWFNVQNTGTGDANVTVTYSDGTTQTATVEPGAAKTFDQATVNLPDPAGNAGFVGSATVQSNGSIVATLMEQGPTTLLGYDGFQGSSASTNPVMPLVNTNNYGYQTGIQIQNTGNTATSVTVSYKASLAGTNCTETQSVPANGSATFALAAFDTTVAGETCANDVTFVGSGQVTTNSTNQPLVAIVNQLEQQCQQGCLLRLVQPCPGNLHRRVAPDHGPQLRILHWLLDCQRRYPDDNRALHVHG